MFASAQIPQDNGLLHINHRNVNEVNERNLSLLQIAARDGQLDAVLELLTKGALVDQTMITNDSTDYINQNSHKSALYFAVERRHFLIAKILLVAGANIDKANDVATHFNDDQVKQNLQGLSIDDVLLANIVIWAIDHDVKSFELGYNTLFENLLITIKKQLIKNNDRKNDEEHKSEDDFSESHFAVYLESLIEYAAYKKSFTLLKTLLQLGNPCRYDIHIRNTYYWLALANSHSINELQDRDIALGLYQLEIGGHFSELAIGLKHASPEQRRQYKQLEAQPSYTEISDKSIDDVNKAVTNRDYVFLDELNLSSLDKLNGVSLFLKNYKIFRNKGQLYSQLLIASEQSYIGMNTDFPGLFTYILSKNIKPEKPFELSTNEKKSLQASPLSTEHKKYLIQQILQDQYKKFDIKEICYNLLMASICHHLTIPYNVTSPPNMFSKLMDPTHIIIDFLNAFEQQELARVDRTFRKLVHDSAYRKTRLILREKGKLNAEYSNLCQQILLMKSFLEDQKNEAQDFGYFQFRIFYHKKRDTFLISMVLLWVMAIGVFSYFFHDYEAQQDILFSELSKITVSDGWDCNQLYLRDGSQVCFYYSYPGVPESCKSLCDTLDSIYPGWAGTLAGVIISSLTTFSFFIWASCTDAFSIKDESRFDELPLDVYSPHLKNTMRELKQISTEDIQLTDLTNNNRIKDFKSIFIKKLGIFSKRQDELEKKLNIQNQKLAPHVQIEILENDKQDPDEEQVAGLDNDDLTSSLLQAKFT